MLKEGMLISKINEEICKDYNSLQGRYLKSLMKDYDNQRRIDQVDNSSPYKKYYSKTSLKGNNWLFLLSKAPSDSSYKGRNSISLLSLVYYETKNGLRVIKVHPPIGVSVFDVKVFKQYKNSMNLAETNNLEIAKLFFQNNGYFVGEIQEENGKIKCTSTCKEGLLHGEFKFDDCWMVYNSFKDKNNLSKKEKEIVKDAYEAVELNLEEQLNDKDFDKGYYQYLADVLEGIRS